MWQLVDGMTIASIHIACEEGVDFTQLVGEVRKVFHKHGVHSTTIQPEFVPRNFQESPFCEQNCVRECDEDWCCKKSADKNKIVMDQFSIETDV